MRRSAITLVVGFMIGLATATGFAAMPWSSGSKGDADRFQQKLKSISENAEAPAPAARRTPVSENEINAYFQFYAADQLPAGIVDPEVRIHGQGRISGRATLDLDTIKHLRSDSWVGALMLLSGDLLPVLVTGVLHTKDGIGRLQIEQVEVSGLPVPMTLLQKLVSRYSRTPDNPEGAHLDDPFTLPARIREIQIEEGRAIIVQ